ncbi:cell division protein FtsB [Deinococcus sp. VB343]|uniref:Cell division protein FtsB n=1 Tax=Deinococcus sp. VB142 TaxID=3112952 RepID=A0AAU6Q0Z5_9DEIO
MDASPRPESRPWQETLRLRGRLLMRLPLTMMVTWLLLLLGSVQLTFQIGNNLYRSWIWRGETTEVKARVADLQGQLRQIKAAEQAAADPEYMQTLARCQGFVKPGETLVVATNAPDVPAETCTIQRLP